MTDQTPTPNKRAPRKKAVAPAAETGTSELVQPYPADAQEGAGSSATSAVAPVAAAAGVAAAGVAAAKVAKAAAKAVKPTRRKAAGPAPTTAAAAALVAGRSG